VHRRVAFVLALGDPDVQMFRVSVPPEDKVEGGAVRVRAELVLGVVGGEVQCRKNRAAQLREMEEDVIG